MSRTPDRDTGQYSKALEDERIRAQTFGDVGDGTVAHLETATVTYCVLPHDILRIVAFGQLRAWIWQSPQMITRPQRSLQKPVHVRQPGSHHKPQQPSRTRNGDATERTEQVRAVEQLALPGRRRITKAHSPIETRDPAEQVVVAAF